MFPAYQPSTSSEKQDDLKIIQTGSWLENKSFPSLKESELVKKHEQDKKEDKVKPQNKEDESRHHSKKKKKKKHKEVRKTEVKIYENDPFFEDRKQERGNFLVSTLHRPAIPKYDKHNQYFKKHKVYLQHLKKKKAKRYFNAIHSSKDENQSQPLLDEKNDEDSSRGCLTKEEELSKVTEQFNKRLAENPNDVDCVLEYVNFQDTVCQFESMYRRGGSSGERVTVERKLAILQRGLERNPASELLLVEKLRLSEQILSSQQLALDCETALVQDPGNLTLWRALVRTSRNSMARCTAPGVLLLFTKALSRINQLRVHRGPVSVENNILLLLVECGLFLQQAGLYEQLTTLLQMYLGLSLTASGQLTVPLPSQTTNIEEEEDRVMGSGLPLSELWLRVERLRAASHFLADNTCESDPQRAVFTDDLAGLVQPVMSPESRLRLVVVSLVLLKVPLLPTTHSLLHLLGLLQVNSAFNNVESLLPALLLQHIHSFNRHEYLSGALDLLTEPQLVKSQQGQQVYCEWVLSLMQHCADLLPAHESVLIHVWTLRLLALLCRLQVLGLGPSAQIVKQARSQAKKLLKQPQWRDNLLLYTEYASIERNIGDSQKAISVLETASLMSGSGQIEHKTLLCRCLVEHLLAQDFNANRERALKALNSLLPLGANASVKVQWQERTTQMLKEQSEVKDEKLTVLTAMSSAQGDEVTDWLACHAYQLWLTQSVWEATSLLQHSIDTLSSSQPSTLGSLWVERLYETQVDILSTHTVHSKSSFSLLRSTLSQALTLYPNNLSLLHTLASIQTLGGGGGTPMWKLVTMFPVSAPLARLLLVFVVRHRVSSCHSEVGEGGSNYLRSLLHQLTREKNTCECPLVWRLHLQLTAALDSSTKVKSTFYQCLQHSPWVKDLYLDAAKFLPEELAEIQDLIIEKEIRLHTMPEELEILRD